MEPTLSAPPVVAVVVTCDPGPWFEEALNSLAVQDYPNLSVLIVDAASRDDPTERVAAVLPGAYVRRLSERVGFGRAANEVLGVVEGASHYLFCHDDVAFDGDAVRLLVEEAYRSNAGIVSPKLTEWDHPERLSAVGAGADGVGVVHPLVDPGELDQEQHDTVRDVFVAPSGATLVRADLFRTLGGFSEEIDQFGEDLDLSWRTQIAGARVIVAPSARARHYAALRNGERAGWTTRSRRREAVALADEHRIRTLLTCYGLLHLAVILPVAAALSVIEALVALVRGHPRDAAATLGSFGRAFRHPGSLWRARRAVQRHRAISDGELRRLQLRGGTRLVAYVRSRFAPRIVGSLWRAGELHGLVRRPVADVEGEATPGTGADAERPGGLIASGRWRVVAVAVGVLAVLLVIGTRHLMFHELPGVGQIPVTSAGIGEWWRSWLSGWQPAGLGEAAPSPPALALLGLAGGALFGAVGTLQHVVVLGPLLVGPLGAYRAARSWGSLRGRIAALVIYATVPVPYDALARGRWPGLLAYAAAPWLLASLGRLSSAVPFAGATRRLDVWRVAALGLTVALVGAFVPSWLLLVPVVGAALALGSAAAGPLSAAPRVVGAALAASALAVVLLLPWSADVLTSRVSTFGVPVGPTGRLGLGDVLRFHTGPVGSGPLGWALLAAAGLPLLIGRSWRLAWAARLWAVALACFGLTWMGLRGWIPVPDPEVVLAPAAAALAGAAALGVVAFELDLPGYRFGWRQLASAAAAVGVVVAALPMVYATGDGRWGLPSADAASVLSFLPDPHAGDYRVLWVGAPGAIPMASTYLEQGVGYATSFDGTPDVTDSWVSSHLGAGPLLATDLRIAQGDLTTKLGHLLAPLAVRYIVIPNQTAPAGTGGSAVAIPAGLLSALGQQTDLQELNPDPSYTVFENVAWAPARAELTPTLAAAATDPAVADPRALGQLSLTAARPSVTGARADRATGTVTAGGDVYVSATRDGAWRLQVGSQTIRPQAAFGWAMVFPLGAGQGGPATLSVPGGGGTRAWEIVEGVLWIALVAGIVVASPRRSVRRAGVRPEWFRPMTPGTGRGAWRSRSGGLSFDGDDRDADETWADV